MTQDYLTYFPDKGIRKGRNINDGYARGWGLQFGDLKQKILNDPLYQSALKLIQGRSILSEDNRMNLFLIMKYFLPKITEGDIIEFGSYKGGNAIFMASIASKLYPNVKVYALDTFAGMPETDKSIDAHSKGNFADVDFAELKAYAQKFENLHFVPGLFEETAPEVLKRVKSLSLVHIDCDIYSAVKYSYECTKPYMVPGGYWVFDDATYSSCIGATEVVEDFVIRRDQLNSEQIFPHFVFRASSSSPERGP